ncbi:MAG TPA: hypothetical protein VH008_18940 [Pseudonocardia sp.]|jgi:hypothetical protein|nr:hypothetical protein [Pseudonocardia sp.]
MFDGTQREHDERYVFGQEWLDLVLKLWSAEMKAYTDTIRSKAPDEHQRDIKTMT